MNDEVETIEDRSRARVAERLKLSKSPPWVHGIGLGGTLLFLVIFVVIFYAFKDVAVWDGWREASEFKNPQYGERIYPDSVFRTRVNTWSNLGFVLFGFYSVALALNDWIKKRPLRRGYLAHTPVQSLLFGLAAIYLGLGSGFFHASLTRLGQQCDVGAMYAVMIVVGAICLGSWLPYLKKGKGILRFPSWPVLAAMSVAASGYFTYYKWDYSFGRFSNYITALLFLFVTISWIQRRKQLQIRWFIAAIVCIVLGGYIRQLDIDDRFVGPDALCQGHAVWHVLSAMFFLFLYLYFRSEERSEESEAN